MTGGLVVMEREWMERANESPNSGYPATGPANAAGQV